MSKTEVFIQYKGTDLCCDLRCECGELTHYDSMFQYFVGCSNCQKLYRMPEVVFPREALSGECTDEGHVADPSKIEIHQ